MGGLRHRSLHVEMKYRFRAARALLGQPPPAGLAHACGAVAVKAVADEVDIGVIVIGRPMALEIVEKARPVGQEPMHFEIAQREREAVVDADQCGHVLGEAFHQPFGDAAPRSVFFGRWRRRHFGRRSVAFGQVNAQALQARCRRLRARIVDADIAGEGGHDSLRCRTIMDSPRRLLGNEGVCHVDFADHNQYAHSTWASGPSLSIRRSIFQFGKHSFIKLPNRSL